MNSIDDERTINQCFINDEFKMKYYLIKNIKQNINTQVREKYIYINIHTQ